MKYLKIFTDFDELIVDLTDEERGRLFTVMLKYATDASIAAESMLVGNERYVWRMAKQIIDREREMCEMQRERGRKGGRPAKAGETQEKPEEAEETREKPEKAGESRKDKDKDKDNDNDNDNKKKREDKRQSIPPKLEDVITYCDERGNEVDPQRWYDYYESVGWKVGTHRMHDWRASIRTWERKKEKENSKPRGNIFMELTETTGMNNVLQ